MFKAVKNVWGSDVKVVEIKSGANHTVARTDDNRLWAWGDNSKGQLGLGDTVIDNSIKMTDKPTQVKRGDSYSDDAYINNIWTIGVGGNNSAAIRHDTVVGSDVVWSWGNNDKGQLGLGSSVTNQDRPVQIKNLSNITYITAGQYHAGAIDKDGNVYMLSLIHI